MQEDGVFLGAGHHRRVYLKRREVLGAPGHVPVLVRGEGEQACRYRHRGLLNGNVAGFLGGLLQGGPVPLQRGVFASFGFLQHVLVGIPRPLACLDPRPVRARFVRYEHGHVGAPNLAIADLRVFGNGDGSPAANAR